MRYRSHKADRHDLCGLHRSVGHLRGSIRCSESVLACMAVYAGEQGSATAVLVPWILSERNA